MKVVFFSVLTLYGASNNASMSKSSAIFFANLFVVFSRWNFNVNDNYPSEMVIGVLCELCDRNEESIPSSQPPVYKNSQANKAILPHTRIFFSWYIAGKVFFLDNGCCCYFSFFFFISKFDAHTIFYLYINFVWKTNRQEIRCKTETNSFNRFYKMNETTLFSKHKRMEHVPSFKCSFSLGVSNTFPSIANDCRENACQTSNVTQRFLKHFFYIWEGLYKTGYKLLITKLNRKQ